MTVEIEDPQNDAMIAHLSRITGESPEEAISHSVKERLERLAADHREVYIARVRAIVERFSALPTLDPRTPDEIIGYNEHGLFD